MSHIIGDTLVHNPRALFAEYVQTCEELASVWPKPAARLTFELFWYMKTGGKLPVELLPFSRHATTSCMADIGEGLLIDVPLEREQKAVRRSLKSARVEKPLDATAADHHQPNVA